MLYRLLILVFFFASCAEDKKNVEKLDLIYNEELSSCYDNPRDLIENDTLVENCLKSVITKYPNKINGYLSLCELLHERKDKGGLIELQKKIKSKFGENSKFLIQKNIFLIRDSSDFDMIEINRLIQKKELNNLTQQEQDDLKYMLNFLFSKRKYIKDDLKKKFIGNYFKS
jgi:hypothetical protein